MRMASLVGMGLLAGALGAMSVMPELVGLSASASAAPALASVQSPTASLTETFGYVGPVAQRVIVPAGASSAKVRLIGGKGGSAKSIGVDTTGGDGALVSGSIAVSHGEVLTLTVAGYGGDSNGRAYPGAGGWGAGGYGGRGGSTDGSGDGGGGGGASSLDIDNHAVALAGGGGGGAGSGAYATVDAGGPGGSSGATVDPGHDGKGPGRGRGGGGAANGAPGGGGGGPGNYLGGAGGGGGAGFGGGGGGDGGGVGGGGGGGGGAGSSHYTSLLQEPAVIRGTTSDDNGLISITWDAVSAPVCTGQTVQVPHNSPGVPIGLRLYCADPSRITSFRIIARPQHGVLDREHVIHGTFDYVPNSGYIGTDSLTFQALTGDQASAPATVTFSVRVVPLMHLDASSIQVPQGHPLVLTLTMPSDATGHVRFYDSFDGQTNDMGSAPIVDGTAVLHTPTGDLGVGFHHIHASYDGDARYAPRDSNTVSISVRAP
jgi:hypothetical protein